MGTTLTDHLQNDDEMLEVSNMKDRHTQMQMSEMPNTISKVKVTSGTKDFLSILPTLSTHTHPQVKRAIGDGLFLFVVEFCPVD